MSDPKWFGRRSVATLASTQSKAVEGVTATVRTMLAAYTQYDDIEFLLSQGFTSQSDAANEQLAKIKERHAKYTAWVHDEVMPEKTNG